MEIEIKEEDRRRGKGPGKELDLRKLLPKKPFCTKYKKLDKGLTYYIRSHSKPKSTIEISLVVNVGSIHEEVHEHGVAHLVEHLTCSRDVDKFIVVSPHNNALTHYEYTMYHFSVASIEDLPGAIALLGGFCSELDIFDGDLDKEKRVVLAEYYQLLEDVGAQERKAFRNLRFKDTKYSVEIIGTTEVISNISLQSIKDFYRRWYRIGNMALIIVGDFPESQSEVIAQMVEGHFMQKSIIAPSSTLPISMPRHREPRFHCHINPKISQSSVRISFGIERPECKRLEDLNKINVANMVVQTLQTRLERRGLESGNSFKFACYLDDDVRLSQYLQIRACCSKEDVTNAFEIILLEIARMRVHGIDENEFEYVKSTILQTHEHNHGTCASEELRHSYAQHFLYNTLVFDPIYETRLQKTLMSKLSRTDLWDYIRTLKSDHNLSVMISEPKQSTTTEDLQGTISKINALERDGQIPKKAVEMSYDPIDEAAIVRGSIKGENYYSSLGLTEWRLSNGMQISFKHTDNDDDDVHIQGFSEGGLSESDSNDYLICSAACSLARLCGSCGFHRRVPGYEKIMWGFFIKNYSRNFCIQCPSSHIYVALQLVYSLFANSERTIDEDRMRKSIEDIKEELSANEKDPTRALRYKIAEAFHGREYTPLTSDDMLRIDPELALDYFKHCFGDPSNFRLIIVGNLDRQKLLDSVLMYLGGIVQKPLRTRWNKFPLERNDIKRIPVNFPTKESRLSISNANVGDQASVILCFPIKLKNKDFDLEILTLIIMLEIIQTQSFNILRHKEGAIYDISAAAYNIEPYLSSVGTMCNYFSVEFQCNPAVARKSVDILVNEIHSLQQHGLKHLMQNGLKDFNLSKYIELLSPQWENNEDWTDWLMSSYRSCHYQGDIESTHKQRKEMRIGFLAKVSEEFIKSAFGRILTNPCNKNFYAMIMYPSSGDEAESN